MCGYGGCRGLSLGSRRLILGAVHLFLVPHNSLEGIQPERHATCPERVLGAGGFYGGGTCCCAWQHACFTEFKPSGVRGDGMGWVMITCTIRGKHAMRSRVWCTGVLWWGTHYAEQACTVQERARTMREALFVFHLENAPCTQHFVVSYVENALCTQVFGVS